MNSRSRIWQFAAVAAVGLTFAMAASVASAQSTNSQPQRISVTTVQVKPDMVGTFEDLIKQTIDPLKEEGSVPWRRVWTTGPFGQAFEYVIVAPMTNLARYDEIDPLTRALGGAGMAQWIGKISKTAESVSTQLFTLQESISVQSNTTTPYKFARVTDLTVLPGKAGEFVDLMRSEYLPALQRAGIPDFWIYSSGLGGYAGVFTMVNPANSYAEFDQPPPVNRGMGSDAESQAAARQAFNVRRNALITSYKNRLLRFLPDLSFDTTGSSN